MFVGEYTLTVFNRRSAASAAAARGSDCDAAPGFSGAPEDDPRTVWPPECVPDLEQIEPIL